MKKKLLKSLKYPFIGMTINEISGWLVTTTVYIVFMISSYCIINSTVDGVLELNSFERIILSTTTIATGTIMCIIIIKLFILVIKNIARLLYTSYKDL